MAGGAPTNLTPKKAADAVRGLRVRTESDKIRLHLVKELIADLIRFDAQLADHSKKIAVILDQHGTRLRDVNGVDPILAARILGCSGRVSGFPTAAAYANYTGTAPVQIASTAPVQIASTDSSRHRLSHCGDRQLNSAFYPIAMIQIRMTDSTGRAFYNKKSPKENHPGPPLAHSNDTWPDTCGASCLQIESGVHELHPKRSPSRLDK